MATIGTRLYTWLFGEYVGDDSFGNKYYRSKAEEGRHVGLSKKERRWVIYNGLAEPSKVPPYWHSWLHYITDELPTEEDKQAEYEWEKPHQPNFTGTMLAYRPPGHILSGGKREKATGDYEAWDPNA